MDQQRLVDLVADAVDPLKSEAGGAIAYETLVVETGGIAKEIARQAANVRSDLIVIRSKPVLIRGALGSIAAALCSNAPCPVLVSRPVANTEKYAFLRILAAHDFSDESELALQNALLIASRCNGQLHLLHVLPAPLHQDIELVRTDACVKELYYQTINRLESSIVADHERLTQNRVLVRWGKTYKEVIDYVKENAIDLVTMGAHGADCVVHTLFGSNIDRVLRLSPSAVLIAHPRKPSIE